MDRPKVDALVQQLQTVYEDAIRTCIAHVTRQDIELVVARYLLNKQEFCDEECGADSQIHFHDIRAWDDEKELDTIRKFWNELKSDKATTYVDEVFDFVRKVGPTLAARLKDQCLETQAYLKSVVSEDSAEFTQELVANIATIKDEFPFRCAVICTLLEMHANGKDPDFRVFETFFEFFVDDLDDFDEDMSETDDSDSEDDVPEKRRKTDDQGL